MCSSTQVFKQYFHLVSWLISCFFGVQPWAAGFMSMSVLPQTQCTTKKFLSLVVYWLDGKADMFINHSIQCVQPKTANWLYLVQSTQSQQWYLYIFEVSNTAVAYQAPQVTAASLMCGQEDVLTCYPIIKQELSISNPRKMGMIDITSGGASLSCQNMLRQGLDQEVLVRQYRLLNWTVRKINRLSLWLYDHFWSYVFLWHVYSLL